MRTTGAAILRGATGGIVPYCIGFFRLGRSTQLKRARRAALLRDFGGEDCRGGVSPPYDAKGGETPPYDAKGGETPPLPPKSRGAPGEPPGLSRRAGRRG